MRLLSLCGLAILLPACGGTGTSGTASDSIFPKEGDVKMLTTTTTKSFDLAASSLSFGERGEASPQTIRINTALTYQPIDGFGAAITGSTAYNLLKMDAADRDAFLRKTFSPTEGYGFSYVRVCIGCSDFSLSEYTCCDTEGIEHFALTAEETDYVIPVLKEILAINPELKIAIVTYSHLPLEKQIVPFADSVDIVSRWRWTASQDYWDDYEKDIKAVREALGPSGQIIQGIYLHDFGSGMKSRYPVPLEVFQKSVRTICHAAYDGLIDGFIIPQSGWFSSDAHFEHVTWMKRYLDWFEDTATRR